MMATGLNPVVSAACRTGAAGAAAAGLTGFCATTAGLTGLGAGAACRTGAAGAAACLTGFCATTADLTGPGAGAAGFTEPGATAACFAGAAAACRTVFGATATGFTGRGAGCAGMTGSDSHPHRIAAADTAHNNSLTDFIFLEIFPKPERAGTPRDGAGRTDDATAGGGMPARVIGNPAGNPGPKITSTPCLP
jgi:hypothetical protein